MKKNIIALAVAAAVAAPVANAAPTVYGKLNLNINQTTDKGMSVNSTASRLGVKGSKDLDGGLKAVYKVEFGLPGVADGASSLSNRNQFMGLAGGFGTVVMGRHDTPFKMSQPSDLFNDGAADVKPFAGSLGLAGGEIRATDVLAYISPSFNGVTIAAATVTTQGTGNADDEALGNGTSIAAMYGSKKKGVYAAVAMDNFSEEMTGGEAYSAMRLSAQYKADGLTANAIYQTFDTGTDTNSGSNIQVGVAYKMGKLTPKAKFTSVSRDEANGTGEDAGTGFAVGAGYSLGKGVGVYAYTAQYGKGLTSDDSVSRMIAGMAMKF